MVETIERKLAAILIADVVGYSRMMHRDETLTLLQLRRHRQEMDALVEEFEGRIIATGGDNIVAEFPSAMDAVAAAVSIQRSALRHNAKEPSDFQMRWRIGVNVGDVMIVGSDLLGGGVNIAARLESLAEPGGVFVSGTVYDQVAGSPHLAFEDLGPHRVKNIDEDVRVYRIVGLGRTEELPPPAHDGDDATATVSDAEERQRALATYVQEARAVRPSMSAADDAPAALDVWQDVLLEIDGRPLYLRHGSALPIYRPQAGDAGRAADLQLGYRRLSRRRASGDGHAEFRAVAGGFVLVDCDSSNGTFLDETYMSDRHPLPLPASGTALVSVGGTREPPRKGACRLVAEIRRQPSPALLLRIDPTLRQGLDDQLRALWPSLEEEMAANWLLATGPVLLGGQGFRLEELGEVRLRLELAPGRLTVTALSGGPLRIAGTAVGERVEVAGRAELRLGATTITARLLDGG